MLQKLIIGALILTVVGAVGLGLYDATRDTTSANTVLQSVAASPSASVSVASAVPDQAPPTPTPVEIIEEPIFAATPTSQPSQNSLNTMGEGWQGSGVVAKLDDVGLTLADGTYIELAPNFYWADIPLAIGDIVTITGFNNGEQIHTQTLMLKGEIYTFRTAEGQPLWSGGGMGNGAEGTGQNSQQVPMSEWQNYAGVLTLVTNNSLTLQISDGQIIELQLGQPRFREDQGVVLGIGDLVEVSGYWQNEQFRVGTLTKATTNETLLLLDPNGRPLWGGPGRTGNNNNGTGQGQGQGQGSGSQGKGYRGGRDDKSPTAEVQQ